MKLALFRNHHRHRLRFVLSRYWASHTLEINHGLVTVPFTERYARAGLPTPTCGRSKYETGREPFKVHDLFPHRAAALGITVVSLAVPSRPSYGSWRRSCR